jgi:hypothetical protein
VGFVLTVFADRRNTMFTQGQSGSTITPLRRWDPVVAAHVYVRCTDCGQSVDVAKTAPGRDGIVCTHCWTAERLARRAN